MKKSWVEQSIGALHTIEDGLMLSILTSMIFLAVGQIALRNFFETSLIWGDPLLRIMVLWTALLGAMAATRTNNHIRIDLLSRFLPTHYIRWTNRLTNLFAAIICGLIAWHAGRFVLFEMEDGIILFSNIPAWTGELIIPIAFTVMALRFFLQIINPIESEQ